MRLPMQLEQGSRGEARMHLARRCLQWSQETAARRRWLSGTRLVRAGAGRAKEEDPEAAEDGAPPGADPGGAPADDIGKLRSEIRGPEDTGMCSASFSLSLLNSV